MNRAPLGRGLASLIPDSAFGESAEDRAKLRVVPIDEVRPNPQQPRETFDRADLDALAASIREHGILSPLVVQRVDGDYVLVAGERRLRAAALAGLSEVPVLVREVVSEAESLELALVENLQRTDLDPVEAARGYQRLVDEYGLTQDEVARRVGRERPTVANALRLLKLPDDVLLLVKEGTLSAGHGRTLLPLAGSNLIHQAVAKVVDEELSVRATEALVNRLLKGGDLGAEDKRRREREVAPLARRLTRALSANVTLKPRKRGGGRIVIDWADPEDLDRLVQLLDGR